MTRRINRNRNTNDVATVGAETEITSGNNAEAVASADDGRIYLSITIKIKDAWIRLLPAATDAAVRKGIYLKKDTTYELPTDNVYTGEVSIINKKNGEKPKYSVTEY